MAHVSGTGASLKREKDPMRRRVISCCSVTCLVLAFARCSANEPDPSPKSPTPRLSIAMVLRASLHGPLHEVARKTLAEFTQETGIPVTYVPALRWKPQRLNQYLEWLRTGAATPDVYDADVTEVWSLAEHMIDLRPYVGDAPKSHFPSVLANYVVDGRLVALPLFTDIQLLLYRRDLLSKYDFSQPPRTWTELERMADRIQAGERAAGKRDFWGLSWTASNSDDLLCVAIECQASYGGGTIIEPDGTISVNNPRAIAAISALRGYVGTISPPGVIAYGLEDARGLFESGSAAFLIHWPFAYMASRSAPAIRGKVGVTLPPSGGVGQVGTLGGWQLSVSKYSKYPREAAKLVLFMTGRAQQLERALTRANLPTIPDLYDEPRVREMNPHFAGLEQALLHRAVVRPSTVAGNHYPQVAVAYAEAVHSVLTDRSSAADAFSRLERELTALTGFPARPAAASMRADPRERH
jgi:trehalose/maltose transport system substrate-binding protein